MFPLMFVDPFCACAGKARRAKAKLKVTSRVIFSSILIVGRGLDKGSSTRKCSVGQILRKRGEKLGYAVVMKRRKARRASC
jgi:hypothetical protein